jgi:hypothetical protein
MGTLEIVLAGVVVAIVGLALLATFMRMKD